MYCGSCLHDNTLAGALLKLGEDVILAPIYTPIRTDEQDYSSRRVLYGGINAYLQQKFALLRQAPRWLDGWLDHPALLRWATKGAGSVDPAKLGAMTVSMLRGEEGNQHKELDKLVDWLIDEVRPDVVHLSNSMMVGMARKIAARCGPPVVCTLSGEDIFLEKLRPPHYEQARRELRERASEVDAFVALNRYYADFMASYLGVPRERVHVIPHGLELEGHGDRLKKPADASRRIGFLARICRDKGLHLLIDACERLAERADVPNFEVHAAGYLGAGDRLYLDEILHRVGRGALAHRFKYHGEVDRAEKIAFLQSLDLMSLPTVYRESKGLSALEAMANGVPVAVPRHGTFPELIEDTGGGVLHEPLDAGDLAEKLATLLANPTQARELGLAGQAAIRERYTAQIMAERILALYRSLLGAAQLKNAARPR
jgi:glycosyltransferase involved in cell wall biosynthesis